MSAGPISASLIDPVQHGSFSLKNLFRPAEALSRVSRSITNLHQVSNKLPLKAAKLTRSTTMSPTTCDTNAMLEASLEHIFDGQAAESARRTRIINSLNAACAKDLRGVATRLPQPNPNDLCLFADFVWSKEQAERFAQDGTLPYDLATVDPARCVTLGFFDATESSAGAGDTTMKLPEVRFDPAVGFLELPDLCAFTKDGKYRSESVLAMISSEDLECQFRVQSWSVPCPTCADPVCSCATVRQTGWNKVRFELKEGCQPFSIMAV